MLAIGTTLSNSNTSTRQAVGFLSEKSIKFDGTDDQVLLPVALPSTFSVSFWFKQTDEVNGEYLFDSRNSGSDAWAAWTTGTSSHTISVWNGATHTGSIQVPSGTWAHVVITVDGQYLNLYVNGEHDGAKAGYGGTTTSDIKVGTRYTGGNAWQGSQDEWAIFSTALTARQVSDLYNNGRPKNLGSEPNLDHWYRMGEGKLGTKSDGESNLLFDQGPNGGLGSELIKADGDMYPGGFNIYGGTIQTYPNGTAARFERPSSGGSENAGFFRLRISGGGTTQDTVVGRNYELAFDFLTDDTDAFPKLYIPGPGYYNFPTGSGRKSYCFTATHAADHFVNFSNLDNGKFVQVSGITFKEIANSGVISGAEIQADGGTELITNGTFDTDVNSWAAYSGGTVTWSNGTAITGAVGTDDRGGMTQTITTVNGRKYTMSFHIISRTSTKWEVYNQTASATLIEGTDLGAHKITFTAAGSSTQFSFYAKQAGTSDGTVAWDNISVKEVTESVPKQTVNLPSAGSAKSLSFDGTDDFATLPYELPATNFTISQWINVTSDLGAGSNLYAWDSRDSSNTNGNIFLPHKESTTTYRLRWWNGGDYRIDDSTEYPMNLWQNVVLVKEGTTGTIYVDGEKLASATTFTTNSNGAEITVGRRYAASFQNAEIDLDEFAVWDTALDGDAVKALYNAGLPTPVTTKTGAYDTYRDNLKAYYRMGDASDPAADGTNNFLFDQTNPGETEMVTNGDFSNGTTGWTAQAGGTVSVVNGRLRITSSSSFRYAYQVMTTRVGGVYSVTLEATKGTSPTYDAFVGTGTGSSGLVYLGAGGAADSQGDTATLSGLFTATTTTSYLMLRSRNEGSVTDAFTDFDNVSVKEYNGHTGTITGATIQTDAPKQIYALPPLSDNNRSLILDGTNDHLVTQVDSTAQPNNESRYYSWWSKSTTTGNNPVFSHGTTSTYSDKGAFYFNNHDNRPLLWMSGTHTRYWVANTQCDDDEWHHWTVRIKYNDLTGCELWCDGVKQAVSADVNSGSMNVYSSGIAIGKAGDVYFNGSIDEFSIHEELDEEAIRALFNRGRPIDISKSQGAYDLSDKALHWWRMGDATSPAADGTNNVIFQGLEAEGSELVTNGDLSTWTDTDTIATWTHKDSNNNGGGGVISQVGSGEGSGGTGLGSANYFTASGINMSLTSGTISEAGRTYRLEIEVSRYVQGIIRVVGAVAQDFGASDIVDGKIVKIFTATSATYIRVQGSGACDFTVDNVSVKQLRGQHIGTELLTNGDYSNASVTDTFNGSSQVNLAGWTSGGSTHTAAAHFVITNGACQMDTDGTNVTISQGTTVVGKAYRYSLEITDYVTGGMTVASGGVTVQANITSNGTYTGVFVATGTTAIDISRKFGAAAKMTIDNVSVKEVVGAAVMTNMTTSDLQLDTPY